MGKSYDSPEHQKSMENLLICSSRCARHDLLKRAAHVSYVQGRGIFSGTFTLRVLGEILGMTILGVLASVEMLGEELGWLGWLFPKLEKLHGTKAAMLLLALIRTIWHLGILIFLPHPLIGLCDLFLSNLLSQGFLVYLTKKSASLFPAAVVHAVTNLLPALVAYSDSFYQVHIVPMNGAGLVSAAVVGGISYLLMRKEKMLV